MHYSESSIKSKNFIIITCNQWCHLCCLYFFFRMFAASKSFIIGHSASCNGCNEIHRLPSRIVIIFTSFLSTIMPAEIAEILSLYNG